MPIITSKFLYSFIKIVSAGSGPDILNPFLLIFLQRVVIFFFPLSFYLIQRYVDLIQEYITLVFFSHIS